MSAAKHKLPLSHSIEINKEAEIGRPWGDDRCMLPAVLVATGSARRVTQLAAAVLQPWPMAYWLLHLKMGLLLRLKMDAWDSIMNSTILKASTDIGLFLIGNFYSACVIREQAGHSLGMQGRASRHPVWDTR